MDERVIAASPDFTLTELDYELPPELIAQQPCARRDEARLLAVDRRSGSLEERRIADLPDLLRAGDLLVLNDTKVLPAKFFARRATGGLVKGLFLQLSADSSWEVILESSGRLRVGETLTIERGCADKEEAAKSADRGATPEPLRAVALEIREKLGAGCWYVRPSDARSPDDILQDVGHTPLPPYIERPRSGEPLDRERYQTVFAARPGAVAAPTAGLHFTPQLLEQTRAKGVEIGFVTLHVGAGTFKPIITERLADHKMHSERFELPESTARAVNECKSRGGRVVAVGTTSVRVLETAAGNVDKSKRQKRQNVETEQNRDRQGAVAPFHGSTDIFIYPPYGFRVVDALLTNFHLPRSTLLALVMAFAGTDLTRRVYQHAISQRYRFYSYGDAMWIA